MIGVRDAGVADGHKIAPTPKELSIKQSMYPGGIQTWGSTPAFLWTQPKDEEVGIHGDAFLDERQKTPKVDDAAESCRPARPTITGPPTGRPRWSWHHPGFT